MVCLSSSPSNNIRKFTQKPGVCLELVYLFELLPEWLLRHLCRLYHLRHFVTCKLLLDGDVESCTWSWFIEGRCTSGNIKIVGCQRCSYIVIQFSKHRHLQTPNLSGCTWVQAAESGRKLPVDIDNKRPEEWLFWYGFLQKHHLLWYLQSLHQTSFNATVPWLKDGWVYPVTVIVKRLSMTIFL